ncbi:MAG: diacylglycerol kinase family protein [Chloroflexota bacterium]|nr:diacylglycerol kinase family protein [Chloroflexota bacterium]
MAKMKVIVNPAAARGKARQRADAVLPLLAERGLDFDVKYTSYPGEAIELAQAAAEAGCETVVAVGGDGTSQEVINGLMQAQKTGPAGTLGVLPVGSGNDFAYGVGIPLDVEAAVGHLAAGQTRVIDLGFVHVDGLPDRYFGNGVGIGFDAQVAVESTKIKRLRGFALYFWALLKTLLLHYQIPTLTINNGQEVHTQPALLISVSNGRRYAGGFLLTPQAEVDDGLFDVFLADEMSRLKILDFLPKAIQGTHIHEPKITMDHATRVVITSEDDLVAHADGEILCTAAHRLEMEVIPQGLRVIV